VTGGNQTGVSGGKDDIEIALTASGLAIPARETSLRAISAELATQGSLNENGRPFAAASVNGRVGSVWCRRPRTYPRRNERPVTPFSQVPIPCLATRSIRPLWRIEAIDVNAEQDYGPVSVPIKTTA
jgi:hypothetical protein